MLSNRTVTCGVVIASALVLGLLASPASARTANFDKPIMGTSDGVNTSLLLEIKNGDPGETVEIRWEKPVGNQVASTQVQLTDGDPSTGAPRGDYSGSWDVMGTASGPGDQDKLILVRDPLGTPQVVDQELGEWVDVGGGSTERASLGTGSAIPTVSQWGLIIMTLLLLTAGTIIIRRRKLATA